jgi:hypothetical protein
MVSKSTKTIKFFFQKFEILLFILKKFILSMKTTFQFQYKQSYNNIFYIIVQV